MSFLDFNLYGFLIFLSFLKKPETKHQNIILCPTLCEMVLFQQLTKCLKSSQKMLLFLREKYQFSVVYIPHKQPRVKYLHLNKALSKTQIPKCSLLTLYILITTCVP